MTTLVAVAGAESIALASDGLVTWGGHTAPGIEVSKIVALPGEGYVGVAGSELTHCILDLYMDEQRGDLPEQLATRLDVIRFFQDFWRVAKDRYGLKDGSDGGGGEHIDGNFLVVLPSGIYAVGNDLSVTVLDEFFAFGSGADYALGALEWALHLDRNTSAGPDRIAAAAVSVAARFDRSTNDDIRTVSVARAPRKEPASCL